MSETKTDSPLTTTLIWRPCDKEAGNYRPDAEKEILIYDGYLDDTVKGHIDIKEDYLNVDPVYVWIDQTTGDPLPDPQFWTDVPFPWTEETLKGETV